MSQTVHLKGNPVTVVDKLAQPGDTAKDFLLVAKDLSDVTLKSYAGKRKVLNIFPSVDTSTCSKSVHAFNKLAGELHNTVVLCISQDLPFAQARFCGAEGLDQVVTLSLLRDAAFKRNYGVEIADGPMKGLAARAVIVIDEQDKVIYSQLVAEIANEPDYDAVLSLLKA